ncbi:hypothetical protein Q8A57_02670 [Porticoccus litoralis]|uniref:Uncharacterized protein n=1 Tax=Porticoccus litoralis TaxID=434086 RepID=A0AAW8B1R7_9GAMM|nr:hypothetical protein [Porticoccus litoralis]MDP1519862.1 hypothetical protein [Porticoccus litoralis]
MKKILLCVLFLSLGSTDLYAEDTLESLKSYGYRLSESTENGAVRFVSVIKTTEFPLRAYKLTFRTALTELMSLPNADKDQKAFIANRARTELWETKFCTLELVSLMKINQIDLVSGDLTNPEGKTQSLAVCM